MRWLAGLLLVATLAHAEGERAGTFDYYVMALSWSPTWCALEGDARGAAQCERDHGWILHGLWPQYERGYPSYCPSAEQPPSRAETAAMADIMGSGGLAWHQWKKHGTCTGLGSAAYFRLSREAYGSLTRPEALRRLAEPVRLPAALIEEAFLAENPTLSPDGVTVTCRRDRIQEVRICLSKELTPMACGTDVARDCGLRDALLDPIR